MTAQHLAWLLLGVACGVASGYPWGRWNGRRALDRAHSAGYEDGHDDGWDARGEWEWDRERDETREFVNRARIENVPRPGLGVRSHRDEPGSGDHGRDDGGPGHPDRATDVACPQCGAPVGRSCGPGVLCHAVRVNVWHDSLVPGPTIAIELAPEALEGSAALQDEGPGRDVPRARTGGRPVTPEQPGPGHSAEWSASVLAAFYGGGDGLPSILGLHAGWDAHMAGYERDVRRVDAEIVAWTERARESLTPAWLRAARILEAA